MLGSPGPCDACAFILRQLYRLKFKRRRGDPGVPRVEPKGFRRMPHRAIPGYQEGGKKNGRSMVRNNRDAGNGRGSGLVVLVGLQQR